MLYLCERILDGWSFKCKLSKHNLPLVPAVYFDCDNVDVLPLKYLVIETELTVLNCFDQLQNQRRLDLKGRDTFSIDFLRF